MQGKSKVIHQVHYVYTSRAMSSDRTNIKWLCHHLCSRLPLFEYNTCEEESLILIGAKRERIS